MDNNAKSIDAIERERKSLDKIILNNPFDDDRVTYWQRFPHVVPAHGTAIKERYIATKWLEEQAKRIITEEADQAVKEENERRRSNNQLPMDRTRKTGEQLEFESQFFTGWQEKIVETIKKYGLYGGVAEEFGLNYTPLSTEQRTMPNDTPLLDKLEDYTPPPLPPLNPDPVPVRTPADILDTLEGKSQPELRSIAKARGITTKNTDTKAELIKMISA